MVRREKESHVIVLHYPVGEDWAVQLLEMQVRQWTEPSRPTEEKLKKWLEWRFIRRGEADGYTISKEEAVAILAATTGGARGEL